MTFSVLLHITKSFPKVLDSTVVPHAGFWKDPKKHGVCVLRHKNTSLERVRHPSTSASCAPGVWRLGIGLDCRRGPRAAPRRNRPGRGSSWNEMLCHRDSAGPTGNLGAEVRALRVGSSQAKGNP